MFNHRMVSGLYGGLVGGVVFGAMMGMMGMLPMIGAMAGFESAAWGFVVHMAIASFIGVTFALLFGGVIHGTGGSALYGLLYGLVWWVLGPLTLMPLFMGMGVTWTAAAATSQLPSLVGHLVYGVALGITYGLREHGAEHWVPHLPHGAR